MNVPTIISGNATTRANNLRNLKRMRLFCYVPFPGASVSFSAKIHAPLIAVTMTIIGKASTKKIPLKGLKKEKHESVLSVLRLRAPMKDLLIPS